MLEYMFVNKTNKSFKLAFKQVLTIMQHKRRNQLQNLDTLKEKKKQTTDLLET